jgi:hypothetical protein
VTLTEALHESGLPFYVPDCPRETLPAFCLEMGYKVGAEIGVYKGSFSEKFAATGLTWYAIDPWVALDGQGRTQRDQTRQDFLYGHACRVLDRYPGCSVIRRTSVDAAKGFADGSLDFVYIDGDHRFGAIAADLVAWVPKVRKGGAVAGHDYWMTDPTARNVVCQVGPVVDAYIRSFGIARFWTFGLSKPTWIEEAQNDRYLSWMFLRE